MLLNRYNDMRAILFNVFFLVAAMVYGQYDYTKYDALLTSSVSKSGGVDYNYLSEHQDALKLVFQELTQYDVQKDEESDQLAYWINMYNVATLLKVTENYPIKSIKDLDGGNPWDVAWIHIGSKKLSLNDIENNIIRKQFNEPRIHFAVNCAAKSCPPLWNRAFQGQFLEEALYQRTKSFLNNSSYNHFDKKTAYLSKIFEWYAGDFGDVLSYIKPYVPSLSARKISYEDYDWALNTK